MVELDTTPICPTCGVEAHVSHTANGVRHPHCGLWSWDGKPLAGRLTHFARRAAHAQFDRLWKCGLAKRNEAYRLLAKELDVPESAAHMSTMDVTLASRVPDAVRVIRKRLEAERRR